MVNAMGDYIPEGTLPAGAEVAKKQINDYFLVYIRERRAIGGHVPRFLAIPPGRLDFRSGRRKYNRRSLAGLQQQTSPKPRNNEAPAMKITQRYQDDQPSRTHPPTDHKPPQMPLARHPSKANRKGIFELYRILPAKK